MKQSLTGNFKKWFSFHSYTPKQINDFWANIIIGLSIAAAFLVLEYTIWGQKNINVQMDFFVLQEADQSVKKGPDDSGLIAFIDIDDSAYKSWGRPALTPRDKVAELIELAVSGDAKVIISDIYFAEPDYSPASALNSKETPLRGQDRDERLRQTLLKLKANGQAKIILPGFPYSDGVMRKFLFDDLLDNRTIFQGIPLSLSSRYDGVLRYWRPEILALDARAKAPSVIWSSPFLAAVLSQGNFSDLDALAKNIAKLPPHALPQPIAVQLQSPSGPRTVHAFTEGLDAHNYHRIRFLLIPTGMSKLNPKNTNVYAHTWKVSSRGTVAPPEKAREFFRNRIVIIGNSSPDWGDRYMTPLGEMPGMYIQGNIVNTIMNVKQIEKPPLLAYCLLQILVVVSASYAFLRFHPFWSHLTISLILLLICWLAYQFFLQTGIFINILFSLAGIGFNELLAEVRRVMSRRQEIKRFILRRLKK